MILLIDNYDSFAHNLARYLRCLGQEIEVVRNDAIDVAAVRRLAPQAIVLSPGPCTPDEAGCSLALVRSFYREIPLLGICLGHQTIAAAFGANIIRGSSPMHGRTSKIEHGQTKLFAELPTPLTVCRYHSLVVDPRSIPAEIQITATCDATCNDYTIMALQHRELPVFGLQFHPEAILTEHGFALLGNFLKQANLPTEPIATSLDLRELRYTAQRHPPLPEKPVTF